MEGLEHPERLGSQDSEPIQVRRYRGVVRANKGIPKPGNAVFTTMVSPTGGIRCGTAIEQNV